MSGEESHVDEFGILKVQTPGVHRSTRAKYLVERLKCDNFLARHFLYMANVVQDVEPTCFDEALGVKEWDAAMNDEEHSAPLLRWKL